MAPAMAAPKASQQQRNIRAGMQDRGGLLASELKYDANAFRAKLPKKLREVTGANTVGGAMRKMATQSYNAGMARTGMSRDQMDRFFKVLDASGRGGRGFQGVRVFVGQDGRRSIQATPMAIRQMELGEKAGSRKPRRKSR